MEVARGGAEYTYRMPPDVAVRPAAAHLRSCPPLLFLAAFRERRAGTRHAIYRAARVVVHWWYKRLFLSRLIVFKILRKIHTRPKYRRDISVSYEK